MSYPFENADYLRVPNYRQSIDVETVDAVALSERAFRADYVDRNRPCLIRGAASHWPACARWSSIDYLKERCGEVVVNVHSTPVIEADALLSGAAKQAWLKMLWMTRTYRQMRFADFLDRAIETRDEPTDELLFLYSLPMAEGAPMAALSGDLTTYAFLQRFLPARFASYPRNNAFFYRASLTDWHYHATAEALQTQILGIKEVLLLPPNEQVWSYMFELHSQRLHLFDCNFDQYPRAQEVTPLRAVLQPGDALYIPAFWWHLVSTRGHRGLGATVPTWWRTPTHVQCDLRFPVNRATLHALLAGKPDRRSAATLAPALLAGAVWSRLRNTFRPDVLHVV